MITVNTHEAKTQLSKLLHQVSDGEIVIIAHAGKPIAKLSSIHRKKKKKERKPGLLKFKLSDAFFEPLPASELELWQK